ncbi:biotin synthase [Thioclava dalianensis]|uniref:Biotin synthase n=1 Tax=Thioclava dalianensis TaxID=1185766 RepID=A0A074TJN7_9RHOB|nr:methyltransferase domain-containing protein [Thioclava dalianensis]KEP70375.1 biotin synthase [Thioclava dalianensis]SFN32242.1 malonyl-CoA O-methyltransferase [Thioclava dalianensis]
MKERIAAGFSRHLASYDEAASVQAQIAARLSERLNPIMPPKPRVIELGHGTGFLTRHLLPLTPKEIWLNDLAAPLPDLQWPEQTRVHALRGDATEIDWPERLDLVASASMLQWLGAPRDLLDKAAENLVPGGLVAVTSFGPGNFPELARLGLAAGAPSYRDAIGLCHDMPRKMEVIAAWDETIRLEFADARALFGHLRATGVNGLMGGQLSVPRLRHLMKRMDRQGPVTLTYRPSCCIARKPGPSASAPPSKA